MRSTVLRGRLSPLSPPPVLFMTLPWAPRQGIMRMLQVRLARPRATFAAQWRPAATMAARWALCHAPRLCRMRHQRGEHVEVHMGSGGATLCSYRGLLALGYMSHM